MQTTNWFEGGIEGMILLEHDEVTFYMHFLNNGALSITVGTEDFSPNKEDLKAVFDWATKVVEAMGIPSDQVVVGAWKGRISK